MSRIRGRDTGPELALRKHLWSLGGRVHTHDRGIPGRPDLSNQRRGVAVFVDGCFWHGCPKHFRPPVTRREFWTEKVRRNQARRRLVLGQLDGWKVVELYECDLKADLTGHATRIARLLKPRTAPKKRGRTR